MIRLSTSALVLLRCTIAASILLVTGACDMFLAADAVQVQLERIDFADGPISLRDSGAIVLVGHTERSDVRLATDHRIRVLVTTSGGDVERANLWHEDGGRGTPWSLYINTALFGVVRSASVSAESFERRVRSAGLVPVRLGLSSVYYVIVFDPLRVASIAHDLSTWAEVDIAELAQGMVYSADADRGVVCPIRIRFDVPHRGDGILQVAQGDTIRALYINPNGDTLRADFQMPLPALLSCAACVVDDKPRAP